MVSILMGFTMATDQSKTKKNIEKSPTAFQVWNTLTTAGRKMVQDMT